jgi:hypothetical protein
MKEALILPLGQLKIRIFFMRNRDKPGLVFCPEET